MCGGKLQELLYKLCWRKDLHLRSISVAVILQIDGDERIALVLQGALVLEAVFRIVCGFLPAGRRIQGRHILYDFCEGVKVIWHKGFKP